MGTAATLAHAAGVPVEEVLPLVVAAATTASVGVRLAWERLRSHVRRREATR